MKKTKSSFKFPMTVSERVIGILMIAIHGVVLPLFLPLLCMLIFDSPADETELTLYCYIVTFIIILVAMFRYLKKSFADIFDNFLGFLSTVIIGYVAYYLMMIVVGLIIQLVNGTITNPNTEQVLESAVINPNMMLVASVLLAPIAEEAMFRGALFGTIRSKSRVLAYIVTAALFAIYHLWQYFYVYGFSVTLALYLLQYIPPSLVLCRAYERSGTVWAPMVIHALINYLSISITTRM
ncbi:MAG: CPBP family intramembrane metalloprotease [Oscillospiraceae bacterium]|nr:CPBP family intramembrane metalloprotease [Oscillospiraceae bacterium]